MTREEERARALAERLALRERLVAESPALAPLIAIEAEWVGEDTLYVRALCVKIQSSYADAPEIVDAEARLSAALLALLRRLEGEPVT